MANSWFLNNNDVVEITVDQELFGSRLINVLHYKAVLTGSAQDGDATLNSLLDVFGSVGGVLPFFKSCQSNDLEHKRLRAQVIAPLRKIPVEKTSHSGFGSIASPSLDACVQGSITKRGVLATKKERGALRLAGIPIEMRDDGLLIQQQLDNMAQLADRLETDIDVSPVIFRPIIWDKVSGVTSALIAQCKVMPEVRTQKTRVRNRGY